MCYVKLKWDYIFFFLKNGVPYTWLAHDFQCKFHWGIHCLCETSLVWYRFKETKKLFITVSSVKSVQYLSFQQWNCVCSNWTSRSVGMQIAEDQERKLYVNIKFVNLCGGPLCLLFYYSISVQGAIYSQRRWGKRHEFFISRNVPKGESGVALWYTMSLGILVDVLLQNCLIFGIR
jgi:hypothetical protein